MPTHQITSQFDNDRPALTRRKVTTQAASKTPSTPQNHSSPPRNGQRLQITIESLNARYRRAIKARGHFPSEQAALKCLYLVTRSLDPTGVGRARWMVRWKPALNAFAITFGDRFPAAETY
jgi:transposase-like protein